MTDELLKLYRLTLGGAVEIYEVHGQQLRQHAQSRTAEADEIRCLIDGLVAQLPAAQRRRFKEQIKTDGMI